MDLEYIYANVRIPNVVLYLFEVLYLSIEELYNPSRGALGRFSRGGVLGRDCLRYTFEVVVV